jgi:gamma-glutamyl phosphate reductase
MAKQITVDVDLSQDDYVEVTTHGLCSPDGTDYMDTYLTVEEAEEFIADLQEAINDIRKHRAEEV